MKAESDARKALAKVRKLAKRCAERPLKVDALASTNDGPGHSVVGVSMFGIEGKPCCHKTATVGHGSNFYNPTHNIASRIADALNPEHESHHTKQATFTGEAGSGGIRTRGEILERQGDHRVKVRAYHVDCWLNARWVTDLEDGTLRLDRLAFGGCKRLFWARKRNLALLDRIMEKRAKPRGAQPARR